MTMMMTMMPDDDDACALPFLIPVSSMPAASPDAEKGKGGGGEEWSRDLESFRVEVASLSQGVLFPLLTQSNRLV